MRNLSRMTHAFQHPLKYIEGKKCLICQKPAVCAIVNLSIKPACLEHGRKARELGYEVAFPEGMKP